MIKFDLKDDPMLCSGHAACPGCIEALSVRHILATMGPDTMAVILTVLLNWKVPSTEQRYDQLLPTASGNHGLPVPTFAG